MPLTLAEIAYFLDSAPQKGDLWHRPTSGFAIDSREVLPGQVFVCLPGQYRDGHQFLQEAIQKGAIAAIVCKDYAGRMDSVPFFRVPNVLQALQRLAIQHVARQPACILAITGSLGKTTVKEFTHALLSKKYPTMASVGNQNSQVGLPLSLLNHLSAVHEYAVLEMAMTEPEQIRQLTRIAPPDIALVTRVALVHAENFQDLEGIAAAKSEIFSHPKTRLGLINGDSPCSNRLYSSGKCTKALFSLAADSSANWVLQRRSSSVIISEAGVSTEIGPITFLAPHLYESLLASLVLVRSVGLSWQEIQGALGDLRLPSGRLELVVRKGITFVNDSYNAAELSVKAALDFCRQQSCEGRRIAVIGQIRELGKFSYDCHKRLGEYTLKQVEELICLGEECAPMVEVWQQAGRAVSWYVHYTDLLQDLKQRLIATDLVLLKGAHSNGLWRIVDDFE
jgi:UDP-N-acetylmuramoyl-tripeptide--D-alanyl-D-alanine ligase